MEYLMIVVFVLGYAAIALEHPLKIDKAASALLTGIGVWALYIFTGVDIIEVEDGLMHHLYEIASILFFLIGAMTIVETVDAHGGFNIITDKIKTTNKVKLMWLVCVLSFFFSAALDNLTTSIVMVSLLRKLIEDVKTRWFFAGMVVISANAGGAWSPIGDVTTTMLWIGGQVTTLNLIKLIFIPSVVATIVPLLIVSFQMKGGTVKRPEIIPVKKGDELQLSLFERNLVFFAGVGGLLFVPIFKGITHLPPFMGMMLSLGGIWTLTELMHRNKTMQTKRKLTVINVIRKIDTASVLFFLGILLAVAALSDVGHLQFMAEFLEKNLGNIYYINLAIGLLSAIVDNVPLVAASMKMYQVVEPAALLTMSGDHLLWEQEFVQDGHFWQFLAYCAGTGGSALIIGSASGVAVMGLERIDFVWYMKKISVLAIIGYFAGAFTYMLIS
jgi:Na+/H+ antiporter NhaD/arsenite permease-like protein